MLCSLHDLHPFRGKILPKIHFLYVWPAGIIQTYQSQLIPDVQRIRPVGPFVDFQQVILLQFRFYVDPAVLAEDAAVCQMDVLCQGIQRIMHQALIGEDLRSIAKGGQMIGDPALFVGMRGLELRGHGPLLMILDQSKDRRTVREGIIRTIEDAPKGKCHIQRPAVVLHRHGNIMRTDCFLSDPLIQFRKVCTMQEGQVISAREQIRHFMPEAALDA